MADKQHDPPVRQLDRRVVERYVKKGILDEKEYHRYLKALPDLAALQANIDQEHQLGFLRSPLEVKKYSDNSIAEEAARRLTPEAGH